MFFALFGHSFMCRSASSYIRLVGVQISWRRKYRHSAYLIMRRSKWRIAMEMRRFVTKSASACMILPFCLKAAPVQILDPNLRHVRMETGTHCIINLKLTQGSTSCLRINSTHHREHDCLPRFRAWRCASKQSQSFLGRFAWNLRFRTTSTPASSFKRTKNSTPIS